MLFYVYRILIKQIMVKLVQSSLEIVSKYDQDIPQSQTADTNPRYREEDPHISYETLRRQSKQRNQLSHPHQDDCKTRMEIKKRTTKHRTITDSHNESNNNSKSTTTEPPP